MGAPEIKVHKAKEINVKDVNLEQMMAKLEESDRKHKEGLDRMQRDHRKDMEAREKQHKEEMERFRAEAQRREEEAKNQGGGFDFGGLLGTVATGLATALPLMLR